MATGNIAVEATTTTGTGTGTGTISMRATSDNNNHLQAQGLQSVQKIVNSSQKTANVSSMDGEKSATDEEESYSTKNDQELKTRAQTMSQDNAVVPSPRSAGLKCLDVNGELNCIGQSIFYDYDAEITDTNDSSANKGLLNQHHHDNVANDVHKNAAEDTTNGNSGANISDGTLKKNNDFNNLAKNYNYEEEEGKPKLHFHHLLLRRLLFFLFECT